MTETEWLASADPMAMLRFLKAESFTRRHLLLTDACCRRPSVWNILPDYVRQWTEKMYEIAEGRLSHDHIDDEWERVEFFLVANEHEPQGNGPCYAVLNIAASCWDQWEGWEPGNAAWAAERVVHAGYIRDIFGNPFRSEPALDLAWMLWQNGTIPGIARQMYDSRDFSDLPILADALEEAGCMNEDILSHCRGPGTHVRGCWAVDWILGS